MILANPTVHELEVSVLIERCLEGDKRAWNALIERYGRLVYSIPRGYGLCESDADDVFQNVFALVYRRMATIRDRSRLSAWLITTAHRECWRIARQRGRQCALTDRWSDPDALAPEQAAAWEQQHMVREALGRLAPRERALMQALFLEPEPNNYEAIARRLGMKSGSIGPTRARCFKKLKRTLIELGFDEAASSRRAPPAPMTRFEHCESVRPGGHLLSRSGKFPRRSGCHQIA